MKPWQRRRSGITAKFDRAERAMLTHLFDGVSELLTDRMEAGPHDELSQITGMRSGSAHTPDDPALARLLPEFHRLDSPAGNDTNGATVGGPTNPADSAAALRSLHEPELLDAKLRQLRVALDSLGGDGAEIVLDDESAALWLRALNDVRLVLGSRLEITQDMPDVLPRDDPRAGDLAVYHWLTYVQETLVNALSSPVRSRWS